MHKLHHMPFFFLHLMLGVLYLGVGGGGKVTNLRAPEEESAGPPVVSCSSLLLTPATIGSGTKQK